jgi:acyl phosphate:glycerol-3-phosphate acyltransferase
MIELGLKFTFGYLLGGVLGSLVVGWFRGGVDIRKLGSGNAGGTNALRTQGKWFALCVMVIDVGKGIFAAIVIPPLALPGVVPDADVDPAFILYAVAFAAVVGHVFPVWFGFRGGKGGATAAGLLVYFAPVLALPILGSWLAIVLFTGYVGLATISAAAASVIFVGLLRLPEAPGLFAFALSTSTLLVFTHRGNIKRMLNGTEARFARPVWARLTGGK